MSIEEYYNAKHSLEAPKELGFLEERNWFREQIQKLKEKLSKEDLAIVNSRDNEWQKKVASSN